MEIEKKLRWWVLHKMIWHTWIGKKHTDINNIPKGQPKHLYRIIKNIIKDLKRENLILIKPTNYGIQISLNPKRLEEIIKYIEENEPGFGDNK